MGLVGMAQELDDMVLSTRYSSVNPQPSPHSTVLSYCL